MGKEGTTYYQEYLKNGFITNRNVKLFLPDEPHVKTWIGYMEEANEKGVFATLKSKLVQLQFPVQESLSQTIGYKSVTLKGKPVENSTGATGLQLLQPESIQLTLLEGPVGSIPILVIPNPDDFADMNRALAHKNEPVNIPTSMGASLIRGLNNWDRIQKLKQDWLQTNTSFSWSLEFKNNVVPNKGLYQDTLMLLSKKPYSKVAHKDLGLSKNKWLQQSLNIRMYHEYAHYYTVRVYGKMSKNIYDEILADYLGISMTYGIYDAYLFLKFIGLEDYPKYRHGGRLENYVEIDQLNKDEFEELKSLCFQGSQNIQKFDQKLGVSTQIMERLKRLDVLCQFGLKDLARHGFSSTMLEKYNTEKSLNTVI